jgi:hypothetical protein
MSKFNRETLCMPCKRDEQSAPGYRDASLAELTACRGGNFNFPGIGLSPADLAFLAKRRKQRENAA